jgi:hypothetical protein
MSHPYGLEILVSHRIDDIRAEANQDQLVALAKSAAAQQSGFAPIVALVNLLHSQVLAPAYSALR